jgi:hypothetical protein
MPNIHCYGTKQQEKINRACEHDFWKKTKEDRSNNSSEFCGSCPLNKVVVLQVQSHSFYIPCGLYGSILEIVLTNSVAQPSQSVNMTERRDPGTQAMSINNI